MIVGAPKEIKDNEFRVGLTPGGAREFTDAGHEVILEQGAGVGSSFSDSEYAAAGVEVVDTAAEVFSRAEMILKVKEPQASEIAMLREGQVLFTYLHLAPDRELTEGLVNSGAVCIAYETVELEDGSLPLLAPMSEVAGRMAAQVGAEYLLKPMGGRGMLMGGVPGVLPARCTVIGGGVVGMNAAYIAVGLGADVTVIDINLERLKYLDDLWGNRMRTLYSNRQNIEWAVRDADLVIGAVLVPGTRAPRLVTREMVSSMKTGSVVLDVSVDQGGCIETIHPTTHSEPTYLVDGVVHYGVANMPGAVPNTSTLALTNATHRYAIALADQGWKDAVGSNRALAAGVNIAEGKITYAPVAEAHGLEYTSLFEAMT